MRARSQPNQKQACVRIAEPGHGPSPILAVPVGSPFDTRHFRAIFHQPWTAGTDNNLLVKNFELRVQNFERVQNNRLMLLGNDHVEILDGFFE
jgi:hypothetical protein